MEEQIRAILLKIHHGETDLISTLTPEMFRALIIQCTDDSFQNGKESAKKEIICMLAASGMEEKEISIILNTDFAAVKNIIDMKKAHIEKCVKKLEKRRNDRHINE
ncbi:MAG: hypothetical protein LBI03_04105 [Clostridiales bacterium]|jgi:hypothetical protein|nr:hypothetical protein [Clostridiales bacterium]